MKNENITKINKLGKVSRIILAVMRVACIIGVVSCLVGSVILGVAINADNNVFNIIGTANAQITVDENTRLMINDEKISIGGIKVFSVKDLEEGDIHADALGTKIDIDVDKTDNNGVSVYDIKADVTADSITSIKVTMITTVMLGAVMCAVMLVAVIFGGKLAKSLEICASPFEENVINTMKKFGFSLIPMAVLYIIDGGIGLTSVVLIIAIIIFSCIFKYGAELQKESDETV
ncbi:MAG: hypothetical protein K2N27_03110 [Ruminococcus sp.]|nr:hypothetical protein [Ruminococcus sp.]